MQTAALTFDPYDYAFQDDPYPTYEALRAHAPLQEHEHGFWTLARHADVAAAFRDESTYSNRMGVSLDSSAWGEHAYKTMSILAMDPPQQTRLRKLVSRGFTPRRVTELTPQILRITRQYLDPALEHDEWDFIAEFAGRLPMDVISELVGVPEADRVELRRLADLLVHREDGHRDVPPEGVGAAIDLFGYYGGMLAERRRRPTDDLTSALMEVEVDGEKLRDEEIIAFLFLLVVAGNETTTKLLGNALNAASRFGVMDDVLSGPDLIAGWVEETLRYDNSTQMLARYVTRDVELHGRVLPAGSKLLLLLGSANRDATVFTDPDSFDIARDPAELARSVSFGGGRHFCLGANLARLEARLALGEIASRVARIEVDHDRAERVHSINVRGFAHLPVRMAVR